MQPSGDSWETEAGQLGGGMAGLPRPGLHLPVGVAWGMRDPKTLGDPCFPSLPSPLSPKSGGTQRPGAQPTDPPRGRAGPQVSDVLSARLRSRARTRCPVALGALHMSIGLEQEPPNSDVLRGDCGPDSTRRGKRGEAVRAAHGRNGVPVSAPPAPRPRTSEAVCPARHSLPSRAMCWGSWFSYEAPPWC